MGTDDHTRRRPHAATALQQCIDAETDRRMRYQWLGADGPECKVQGISRAGGTIIVDKTCISGISSRSVITGDFDSAYAVQVTSSHHVPAGGSIVIETPGGMIGRDGPVTVEGQKSSIAAKFLGDCKVGCSPGGPISGTARISWASRLRRTSGGLMRLRLSLLALTFALPAAAQDLPPRKPGLWELTATQTIQSSTSPAHVSKHCIDAVTDKAMQTFGGDLIKAKCDRLDWRREGKDRVLHAGCLYGAQPFKVFAIASGKFETHYKTTMTVTRIGRPDWPTMPPETVFNTSARWVGACLAGQKPGDMILANGTRMNIRDVPEVAARLPPEPPRFNVVLPVRKAGLWEIRSSFLGGVLPGQSVKACVSLDVDRAMIMARTSTGRQVH